jgi:hypothetical protein
MKLSIIAALVLQAVIAIAAPTELVKDAVSSNFTLVIDEMLTYSQRHQTLLFKLLPITVFMVAR